MKILLFSHSSSFGGAENALRYFVQLLQFRHEVHVVLPQSEGTEVDYFKSIGISCYSFNVNQSLPNFSNALVNYSSIDFDGLANFFKEFNFDLAITNTLAILHGGLIASRLNIPHLTYAHEYLFDDELLPTSISKEFYLKIVESLTTYFFSCSNFISNQFTPTKKALFNVVEPHNFSLPSTQRDLNLNLDYVIQVIGTQSFRKNHNFAITLSKSLALRGLNVRLDIIGTENNATSQINQLIRKRQINCRLIAHTPRPFDLNLSSNVITLVSSTSEPYGLTIPESLRHGIPVIASRSGGPIELLPDDYLFDTDDLHSAGLIIESIFRNYSLHVNRSIDLYNLMQSRNQKIQLQKSIDDTLTKAIVDFKSNNESFLWNLFRKINTLNNFPLSIESVAQSITEIRDIHSPFDNSEFVADLIVHEQKYPGSAVLRDVMNYDVIPFAKSTCMDHLYKHGIGLSVELASTYIDHDRIQMMAFIICALLEKQNDTKTPLKVLALGDGIGIDSIRLALVGFEVDYLDYETSNMSRIADLNIQKAKKLNNSLTISVIQELSHGYDAIVCLEVIAHVAEPKAFIDYIHTHLKEDGLLFISECFNGIEDRWPTHLFSSEKYSALLPFMMASNFSLLRYNKSPLFKPYVYTKRSAAVDSEIMSLFSDRSILQSLISNKLNLGV